MSTILITGANGFIGTELTSMLKSKGYSILEFNSSDGDIASNNFVEYYKDVKINHVFHLASQTYVPDSWINPLKFYKTSVLGTGQILELCRHEKIPLTFVSAYLYGQTEVLPIKESSKVNPNNPYAHSKYLAEDMCKFYSEYYDVKVTIARPFNIYGKKQKEMFLIPHIINQALTEDTIKVKDLLPKRDYIYITDLVNGLIKTLETKNKFSVYNFGSGIELSVAEIIKIIQDVIGTNKKVISEKKERSNEIMNVIADIECAKNDFGWMPKFSFKDGIEDTIKEMKIF